MILQVVECIINYKRLIGYEINFLILSYICVAGSLTDNGTPIVTVEANKVMTLSLKATEVAHILLYYNTIPLTTATFTILITANDSRHIVRVISTLDNAIKLLQNHVKFEEIVVAGTFPSSIIPKELSSGVKLKCVGNKTFLEIFPEAGIHVVNDQRQWIKFFTLLESFQEECLSVGQLVLNMSGLNGVVNHQELAQVITQAEVQKLLRNGTDKIDHLREVAQGINDNIRVKLQECGSSNDLVLIKLEYAQNLYQDIKQIVSRVEALLERRQEVVREKTRRKTIEKEISEVISPWITSREFI